jgi:hypothetical protein
MIRRGLQFIAGVGILMMLGVAPCSAQNWPNYVILQGFTNASINGYYVNVAGSTTNTPWGYAYQRYAESATAPDYWITLDKDNAGVARNIKIYNQNPVTPYYNTPFLYGHSGGSSGWPTQFSGAWRDANWTVISPTLAGAALPKFDAVPDEYTQAFPDWSKAATLIPLGFTFAMAFWGASVALTIPMKWIRDLTSSAT